MKINKWKTGSEYENSLHKSVLQLIRISCTLTMADPNANKNMFNLPQPVSYPRTGRKILCTTSKALQFGITTFPGMKSFPFQNLLPCLFVIGIMDPNNIIHVLWCNVLILPTPSFAKHCVPEHLQKLQASLLYIIYRSK